MKTQREQIKVDGNAMSLYSAQPDGSGPFAALVVIQHQYGVDKFMEEMTERFARDGFFAICPDLYHRDGPDCQDDGPTRRGRARDENIIQDIHATMAHIKANAAVDSRRVAILGFCMGGRIAYLMAAASTEFKAAVDWYGGSCFRRWGDGPTPFERTAQINCPIQGHFGATDQNPTLDDVARLAAELTKFGKAHEFFIYQDTGHSFMDPHHPDRYVEKSDRESWARSLEFLRKHLG